MKYTPVIILIFAAVLFAAAACAEEASSFDEAKALSAKTGKPVLLEFVRED